MRIFFALIFLVISCITDKAKIVTNVTFPYNLNKPDETYILPAQLKEISGIAFSKGSILCIQDEEGIIYKFEPVQRKLTGEYKFGNRGDYEDIAVRDNTVFVLKSNGEIFRIENPENPSPSVSIQKTPLTARNNAEGLVFDKSGEKLLIACKGFVSVKGEDLHENARAVFSFDPESLNFSNKPLFIIDLSRKEEFSGSGTYDYLQALKKKGLTHESSFQPSGIAVHPLTNEIFIISSTGSLILILSNEGKIKNLQYLNPEIFTQPEGICFSPSGELFISNEGRGGDGTILSFSPHSDN